MDLKQQGFRYTYLNGTYSWKHPAEVPTSAVDCTDMSDARFSVFVRNNERRALEAMHPEQN